MYRRRFDRVTTSSHSRYFSQLIVSLAFRVDLSVVLTFSMFGTATQTAESQSTIPARIEEVQMNHILALVLMTSGLSPAPVTPTLEKEVEHATPAVASATSRSEVRLLTSRERILKRRQTVKNTQKNRLRGGQQQATDGLISLIQTNVAPDCWEFGGSGFSGAGAGGAGNGSSNSLQNAENLAELIQQTTRPLSWEINGGNGSISIFSN